MIAKILFLYYTLIKKLILFLFAGIMCLTSFAPPEPTTPTVMNKDTGNYFLPDYGNTLISSHRSGKGAAPENTLMAVKSNLIYAEDASAIIEMDVQLTKDGEIVLYHSLSLDEMSNSAEYFGQANTTVFMKTYDELRELNMGENFKSGDSYPYRGLRGEDIPDDIRITLLKDVFACVESEAPGKYRYIIEIKYPHPWAPKIVDGIYELMCEYGMVDRVIVASFWPDVSSYIDKNYDGKINRSANPFEIVDLYGCYIRNEDLSGKEFKYAALQMPYYWDDGKLLVANLGSTSFIDYAHKYGISMQYWTVNKAEDAQALVAAGADLIMTDYPDRIRDALGR
jgi:glycerophosphoryl diester phosphodiesterase